MFHHPTTLNTGLLSIIWATCAFGAATDVNLNDPFEVNKLIGRGINFGNTLDLDREVKENDEWGWIVKDEHFQTIKDAGFNSVRLTVRWSTRTMDKPPYTIDPNFLKRVDDVVNSALSRHLTIIINYQNFLEFYKDPNGLKPKFLATWEQLAEHYKDYPNTLLFELLNEPQGNIGAGEWNALLKETLEIVRKTNPHRMIVIGPANFNAFPDLRYLVLPESDRNIILTIHYYSPREFTHQGAKWVTDKDSNNWIGTTWMGSGIERGKVRREFDQVASWAKTRNRPVYLGEFGSYEGVDIMDSRVSWTKCVADEAVANGFSFTYWQFTYNFAVYDRDKREWIKRLLNALIPPK